RALVAVAPVIDEELHRQLVERRPVRHRLRAVALAILEDEWEDRRAIEDAGADRRRRRRYAAGIGIGFYHAGERQCQRLEPRRIALAAALAIPHPSGQRLGQVAP